MMLFHIAIFFVFFKSEITQSYSFTDLLHTLFHTLKQNTSSAMVMSWVAYLLLDVIGLSLPFVACSSYRLTGILYISITVGKGRSTKREGVPLFWPTLLPWYTAPQIIFPRKTLYPPLPLVIVYNVNRIKSSIWLPLRKRAESQGSALFHWSELMTYDPDGSDSFCICLIYKKTAEIHVLRVYRGRDSAFFQYFPCYT